MERELKQTRRCETEERQRVLFAAFLLFLAKDCESTGRKKSKSKRMTEGKRRNERLQEKETEERKEKTKRRFGQHIPYH